MTSDFRLSGLPRTSCRLSHLEFHGIEVPTVSAALTRIPNFKDCLEGSRDRVSRASEVDVSRNLRWLPEIA